MIEWYLYIKALHIIFFTCWFAGLFYLPRIYVNLAMVNEQATYDQLVLMATKLYRFITPFMVITIALGIWMLLLNTGLMKAGWMHTKLLLIVLLVIYHFVCGSYLKKFTSSKAHKSHVYYRWFNEFPVLILFSVVILAVAKPF